MARAPRNRVPLLRCGTCGREYLTYDGVVLSGEGGGRELCRDCFNRYIAERMDVDFQPTDFVPYKVRGPDRRVHTFHFRSMLVPTGRVLEAFELVGGAPGGYQFKVLGDFDDDAFALCAELVERIRRRVGVLDLEKHEGGRMLPHARPTRGHIEYAEHDDGPAVVIDGRTLSWAEFGHLLGSYEGWQFRLQIVDPTDEA